MISLVHFIPLFTSMLAAVFFVILYRHWKERPVEYNLWWMIGIGVYGLGTLTESLNSILGWNIVLFKTWYIVGALLGGAPLAQGTIYLLLKKKTADGIAIVIFSIAFIGIVLCILSPVDYSMVETYRLSGRVLSWKIIHYFPPIININSLVFFVGGALWSAMAYWKKRVSMDRFYGNLFIALGGLLPGIGGWLSRYGYLEALFVSEFFGIILIYLGYLKIRNDPSYSIHQKQPQHDDF